MNLELGIVNECGEAGCDVQLLGADETTKVRYSAPMQDVVKVRAGQLVAVDLDTSEVVYRVAHVGEVEGVREGTVSVIRLDASGTALPDAEAPTLHVVPPIEGLEAAFDVGDKVFFTSGEQGEVLDSIVDGQPGTPDRIRTLVFPKVEEIYEGVER